MILQPFQHSATNEKILMKNNKQTIIKKKTTNTARM